MSEDTIPFEVTEEVALGDVEAIKEQRNIKPKAQGVRVKIEKPAVRKALSDGAKNAPKEGPNNPLAYKYLNCTFRLLDGISVPVYDGDGNSTGETEIAYKNAVIFPNKMDLIFWHNAEVKTSNWWKNKQYIFGFKALCKAVGLDTKNIVVNDQFLADLKDKEILIDIDHEEENELKNGEWVGKGTFKERLKNFRPWS